MFNNLATVRREHQQYHRPAGQTQPIRTASPNTTQPPANPTPQTQQHKKKPKSVDVAKLHSLRGRAVHDEGSVAGERPRVERAAAVQQPPVLLRTVRQNGHVRQRVERESVVQLPMDGPRRQRQRAQVSLVQERLGALVWVQVGRGGARGWDLISFSIQCFGFA